MKHRLIRVNKILKHPDFLSCVREVERLEKTRPFCGHGMEHLLAVARLACIENLEEGHGISRERIYAAALVHDLGRLKQYQTGECHHTAGLALIEKILRECDFREPETAEILEAVAEHGNPLMQNAEGLKGLLYRADKKSRMCWNCAAEAQCEWDRKKKNLTLSV